jgi:hypothetical protein
MSRRPESFSALAPPSMGSAADILRREEEEKGVLRHINIIVQTFINACYNIVVPTRFANRGPYITKCSYSRGCGGRPALTPSHRSSGGWLGFHVEMLQRYPLKLPPNDDHRLIAMSHRDYSKAISHEKKEKKDWWFRVRP